MYSKIILPASVLAGTIIGAGMFSLPFVFKAIGLATGFFYLLGFSLIFIFIYLLYSDVIIRTPGEHRFVGFSGLYLGEVGFITAIFIGFLELIFSLTIYLILAPSFSSLILGGNIFYHILFFWILGSAAVLFKIKRIAFIEFLITGGIIFIIALIFGLGFDKIPTLDWGNFNINQFFAAGPILFALAGSVAIPETIDYFRKSGKKFHFIKKALLLGGLLPVVAYGLFVVGVIGLSSKVSENSISGLIGQIPELALVLVGILGLLSLFSSYIVIGLNLRKLIQFDFGVPELISKILVVLLPPIFYLIGFKEFLSTVAFVGIIFMPIDSIFIILMWLKANKKLTMPPVLVSNKVIFLIPVVLVIFAGVIINGILIR